MQEGCRLCGTPGLQSVLDLGVLPVGSRLLASGELADPEAFFPLQLMVCSECLLVQIADASPMAALANLRGDVRGIAEEFVESNTDFGRDTLSSLSMSDRAFVIGIETTALGGFAAAGIRTLRIDPRMSGGGGPRQDAVPVVNVPIEPDTTRRLREEYGPADLVVVDAAYDTATDLVALTAGLRMLVADQGWISIRARYLPPIVQGNQFDAVQHGQLQYYTVWSMQRVLNTAGLTVVDVEPPEAGAISVRLWARPVERAREISDSVFAMLEKERSEGMHSTAGYADFANSAAAVRRGLLRQLMEAAEHDRTVVAYGASARASNLVNYCRIGPDLLRYTVTDDAAAHGMLLPGSRIPVAAVSRLAEDRPHYVLVLPWYQRTELTEQLSYVGEWGGRLLFPIPQVELVEVG